MCSAFDVQESICIIKKRGKWGDGVRKPRLSRVVFKVNEAAE